MAITPTLLTTGTKTSPFATGVTASISPAANSLLLVVVMPDYQTTVDSVSGLGLTYTKKASSTNSNAFSVELWTAQCGASPGSGSITIGDGSATSQWGWHVLQVTGHDTVTPIRQPTTGGGASGGATVTLASGAASADSRTFAAAVTNLAATALTNWTSLANTAPNQNLATMWRSDAFTSTAGVQVSGAAYNVIGFEIAAAASAKALAALGVG